MISFYKEFGDLGYLANYSNHGFYEDGVYYKTVEHYYQSHKFSDPKIREKIINAETPKEASNIGRDRNLVRIPNFKDIKLKVMEEGIYLKFKQNKDILYKLIETRNEDICEATIDEYYWGIGKDKSGLNHIGQILVNVRERLRNELLSKIIDNCRNKKVYIVGHKNSDMDSYVSTKLMYDILSSMGLDVTMGTFDKEVLSNDKKLIKDTFKELPLYIDDVSNKYFLLVDHNNLEGLNKDSVVGAIDHHIITNEVSDTLEIEYASCSLFIYDLFKDRYSFNDLEKKLIYLATLCDTDYLYSSRLRDADKILLDSLGVNLSISYYRDNYMYFTDLSKDILSNLKEDYKEYQKDKLIKRSIIRVKSNDKLKEYEDYVSKLDANYLLMWCNYLEGRTYIYYLSKEYNLKGIVTSTNLVLKYIDSL